MKSRLQLRRSALALGMTLLLGGLFLVALFSSTDGVSHAAGGTQSAARIQPPVKPDTPPQPYAPRSNHEDPARAMRDAWERARATGVYSFATDLVQTTYPAMILSNAGRGPGQNELYLEGGVNLPKQSMTLQLWQGSGSVLIQGNGSEARIEDGKAWVRRPGGSWQESQDFSSSFAPGADPLAFLAGMKNVRSAPSSESAGAAAAAHYAFDLDGRAFATYVRDSLEEQLRDRGELPLNVTLETPAVFKTAKGSGELWVDDRGLPLRLTVHLVFAELSDGSHLEADIKTDFSGFPVQLADTPRLAEDPLAWAGAALGLNGLAVSPAEAAKTAGPGGAVACGALALALIVGCRRSRRLYVAVVIAVTVSMVVVPLLQSQQASAFFEGQAAKASQSAQQASPAGEAAPAWDPHGDPASQGAPSSAAEPSQPGSQAQPVGEAGLLTLTAAAEATTGDGSSCNQADTGDTDGDGLNNYEECYYTTDPVKADMDGDGLGDGQEVNRLGTDPRFTDTDGDAISDKVEVEGFVYGGQRWYLDPNNPDTNGDGVVDSVDCTTLATGGVPGAECDTDGDGTPNPFDRDNDEDGVPDQLDLSDSIWTDLSGAHKGPVSVTPFDQDHPFLLVVQQLQPGWPVLVDLQLRPTNAKHLSYALNVLDWPDGDRKGQIERENETTWATTNPKDIPGAHGDMRLVPLLELTITGSQAPLKMTTPAITVTVQGQVTATVVFTQASNSLNTDASFSFEEAGPHEVSIYAGECSHLPALPVMTLSNVLSGDRRTYQGTDQTQLNDLADGSHSMLVKQVTANGVLTACTGMGNIVNGLSPDKMVDQSVLAPYGISVMEESGTALQAYLPLTVVSDESGGGKTAFQAHMLYWPDANNAWVEPQQARVVWAVNMLTDECEASTFPSWEKYKAANSKATEKEYGDELDKHCETHRTPDQVQVIQTYPDSWYLTGLTVREDHGLDVAVAYPNPAKPYDEDALWRLSSGLGDQFLPGPDCETDASVYSLGTCEQAADNLRDLTIFEKDHRGTRIGNSTISSRFGVTSTAPLDSPARWGLANDAFVVENFAYDDVDYQGYIASHETPRILGHFDRSVAPTLLFVREERFRSAGLGDATVVSGLATLAVTAGEEEIWTGLSWAPFRYRDEMGPDGKVVGWEGYPADEYWDVLQDNLRAQFRKSLPNDDPEATEGRTIVARGYYLTLMNGVTENVKLSLDRRGGASSDAIINAAKKVTTSFSNVAIKVLEGTFDVYVTAKHDRLSAIVREVDYVEIPEETGVWKSIGSALGGAAWAKLFDAGKVRFGVGLALGVAVVAGAVATLALTFALGKDTDSIGLVVRILYAVNLALATFTAVNVIAKAIGDGLAALTKNLSKMDGKSTSFGVLACIVQIGLMWAAFGLQIGLGSVKAGSMAFDNALASTIAAMIGAILLFVLFTALGPLGSLIKAIMGLIDALVALICNAFLSAEQQASRAAKWLCGGISGFINNVIKWFLYSGSMIVELNPSKEKGAPRYPRLTFGNFQVTLADPEAGLVTGNPASYSIAITNTIDLAKRPIAPLEMYFSGQFNDTNLKKSTFDYKWQTGTFDFHSTLHLGGMSGEWQPTEGERPFTYKDPALATTNPIPLPAAGINQTLSPLYLSEAYAAPEQECWGAIVAMLPVGGCRISTERATLHYDVGASLILDILPATLDDFYLLNWVDDGSGSGRWVLSWGRGGDLHFPGLDDADGDGLYVDADPNDSQWDTDGDELSDLYEKGLGSNPTVEDTDGDGLSDAQEARLGTNPRLEDSEGDGLPDGDEVYHQDLLDGDGDGNRTEWLGGWEFVYGHDGSENLLITRVYSDPKRADADGDTLSDKQEQTFGYNPNVPLDLNVLSLQSEISEIGEGGKGEAPTDRYVMPGDTLHYTGTVKNELDLRQAEGLLSMDTSLVDADANPQPMPFVLDAQEEMQGIGTLTVDPETASGAYSVTQVAGALITDWRTGSGNSSLWLRFDDDAGTTTYRDTSGSQPAHDGSCVGPAGACTIVSQGRYGGAIQLDGTGYVHSDAAVSSSDYAVSFWFKASTDNPTVVLFTDATMSSVRGAGVSQRRQVVRACRD